jgi:transposase
MEIPLETMKDLFSTLRALVIQGSEQSRLQSLDTIAEIEKAQAAQNEEFLRTIARLQRRIGALQKNLFGRSTERDAPGQSQFFEAPESNKDSTLSNEALQDSADSFGVTDSEANQEAKESRLPENPKKRREHRGRRPLPPEFKRVPVKLEVPESDRVCSCGQCKIQTGTLKTEVAECREAEIIVHAVERPILVCEGCEQKETTAIPPEIQPLPNVKAGPALLVKIILDKYQDHIPLARQADRFLREGWDVSRSTLCDWIDSAAWILRPVADEIFQEILASPVCQFDYTSLDVRIPVKQGKAGSLDGPAIKRWYSYAYTGPPGSVYFECVPGKGQEWPYQRLQCFNGFLQADSDRAFDKLFQSEQRLECGCWAHVRRKFFELRESDKRALLALAAIRKLYQIESKIRELSFEERRLVRDKESRPIVEKFFAAIKKIKELAGDKPAPILAAVQYALNIEAALKRFLDNGAIEIDNNRVERHHKRTALGRKNWLFAGSEDGAIAHSTFSSLLASCAELGINPREYLTELLVALASLPRRLVKDWTPRAWLARKRAAEA